MIEEDWMYDSYSDYYGMYDVEEKKVNVIEYVQGDKNKGVRRKPFMTKDEQARFVIERSIFMNKLHADIEQYDNIIDALQGCDMDVVNAYKHMHSKVQDIADASIESFEDLEFYQWMYNGGDVRSKDEEKWARAAIQHERQMQEDMDYRNTEDYKVQKTIFVIMSIVAIWFLPGWICSIGSGDFHFHATIINLVVMFFLNPLQLFLTALAFLSDGFVRLGTKEDRKYGVKRAATAAGISAVMQARTMSKVGKSLMSGGNKI